MVDKIEKRDGRIVSFDINKIAEAIKKAIESVHGPDGKEAKKYAEEAKVIIEEKFKNKIPKVEEIQDIIENVLIKNNQADVAKSYIIYRQKHKEIRQAKSMLGIEDDIHLSMNAVKVLEKRYLKRNAEGKVVETPGGMFKRVAHNIAQADLLYDTKADVKKTEEDFYTMMTSLEFMPNSPTLMNAGKELQQLAACFVLPVPDDMEGIFDAVKYTALIHQSGGGTGFSFSRLRPQGDIVKSTGGVASGPISFMKVFNASTDVVKQGGTRRGANMGILRVDHPDILDFIIAKEREESLTNFNISVAITDKFMEAVKKGENYDLINPRNGQPVKSLSAKSVFDLIKTMAWKNGEPGIIFIDRVNRDNPTPKLGMIESTNPCGEQPLLPFESCNLGSINLAKMVQNGKIDWVKLEKVTQTSVHFLDNVIDMGKYPLEKIRDMVHGNRKIGLGVMGFADMLILLKISYNSDKAVEIADQIMKFIKDKAKEKSVELAKKRGTFPNFKGSIYDNGKETDRVRNATLTTIAPTGTISIIANASSGIEPLFAISFIRNVMDGTELLEVNPLFERIMKEEGLYSEQLMREIAKKGSIYDVEQIPDSIRKVFVTSHEIAPEYHVKIQAAFQKHIDNAVSKTVNFSNEASVEDIAKVYLLAYNLGCKGVTVYRDGSRSEQVLNIEKVNKKPNVTVNKEGIKVVDATFAGGCEKCNV